MVGEMPYLDTNQSIIFVHIKPSVTHQRVVAIFTIQIEKRTAATKLYGSLKILANKFSYIAQSVSTLRDPNSIHNLFPRAYL